MEKSIITRNAESSWHDETTPIRYISPFPCPGQYFDSTTRNEKDATCSSSKSVSWLLRGINDKKEKVFPLFFFKVGFGEYTLLVQVRMSYCQTQVFLLEKNVESIQRKSAKGKRKAAAQESDICGDSYHKTYMERQFPHCQSVPYSLKKILQDLFCRRNVTGPVLEDLLLDKWSVTCTCWHLSYLPSCIFLSCHFQMTCLSAGTPCDAVTYQPCQKNIYERWLVGLIFNLSYFSYLSVHLILQQTHVHIVHVYAHVNAQL